MLQCLKYELRKFTSQRAKLLVTKIKIKIHFAHSTYFFGPELASFGLPKKREKHTLKITILENSVS